jgi:hypothetical protein
VGDIVIGWHVWSPEACYALGLAYLTGYVLWKKLLGRMFDAAWRIRSPKNGNSGSVLGQGREDA